MKPNSHFSHIIPQIIVALIAAVLLPTQSAQAMRLHQSGKPPIKLAKVQKLAEAGYSFQPLVDFKVAANANNLIMSRDDDGFMMVLANGLASEINPEKAALADLLTRILRNMAGDAQNFTADKTKTTMVGRRRGVIADFSGVILGRNAKGAIVLVQQDASRIFYAVGISQESDTTQNWKDYGNKAFAAVVKTVKFFAPVKAVATPTPVATIASQCPISTDPTYGYSADNPIQVGGDFMSGPARERAYLDALRGPNGEAITYERRGSVPGKETILDAYEITYPGLKKPVVLYLDQYRYSDLKAPIGFVCAQPIPLGAP
jgi:hypothetical protein